MKKFILVSLFYFGILSVVLAQNFDIRRSGSAVSGFTVYMDATNGNDVTASRTAGTPFLSLSNACNALLDDDKLLIRPGRYYITPGSGTCPDIVQPPLASWRGASSTIRWKTNIVIEGYGATLVIPTNICDVFDLVELTNITIRGLTFETPLKGSGLSLTSKVCSIHFRGLTRDWKVQDCRFINGINTSIGANFTYVKPTNGIALNNSFNNCGSTNFTNPNIGDGACIENMGSRLIIEANLFVNCFRAIEIERVGGLQDKYKDYIIKNNRFDDIWESAISIVNSTFTGTDEIDSILIEGNSFTGLYTGISYITPTAILSSGGNTRLKIHNNVFGNYGSPGVSWCINVNTTLGQDLKDVVITDNLLKDSQYGIQVYNGTGLINTNCLIARNTFYRMTNNAIIFQGQRGFILGNIINEVGNNGDLPIRLQENGGTCNQYNFIEGNNIFATLPNSIYLTAGGSNNYINHNSMAGYTQMPLQDLNPVGYNTFTLNNISGVLFNGTNQLSPFGISYNLFTQTANGSDTNITTTTNTIWGTGIGTRKIDASMAKIGKEISAELDGNYWTPATPGQTRFLVCLTNSVATNILAQVLFTPPSSLTGGDTFTVRAKSIYRTLGTSGTISTSGRIDLDNAGTITTRYFTNNTATVDTTQLWTYDIATTNGASTVGYTSINGSIFSR